MKKTFQLILAGVLACAMLTACGKTNGSVQTTAGKQEQTEGSDTANGEKTPEKPIKDVYLVNGN